MKLSAKKAGNGYSSSYTISISKKEAKLCGFLNENNEILEIEKKITPNKKSILITLKSKS